MLGFEFAIPPLHGYALLPNRVVVPRLMWISLALLLLLLCHIPQLTPLVPRGSHLSSLTCPRGRAKEGGVQLEFQFKLRWLRQNFGGAVLL